MAGTTDQVKGKVEEAAGDLTGDAELKREGQIDQAAGKTKSVLGDAADWAADRLKDVSERLSHPEGDDPTTTEAEAKAAGRSKERTT